MKNTPKICLLILGFIFLSIQIYWRFRNDGNLIILIQNQSDSLNEIPVQVTLEGKYIFHGNIYNTEIVPQEFPLRRWPGFYILTIVREDSQRTEKQRISLALVTWIVINVTTEGIKVETHLIPPLFQ